MQGIKYSIGTKKCKNMCDIEESGEYVRSIEVLAHSGDKIVGRLDAYIFDMYGLMEADMLEIFDESAVLDRVYSAMYHGVPLTLDNDDITKGFRPEFLSFINEQFGDIYDGHDHPEFEEWLWTTHYNLDICYVENVVVDKELRGHGIGNGLMRMLKRLVNDIDLMILQSFPNAAQERIRQMNLTYDQEKAFKKTSSYENMLKKEQQRVNDFYQNMGFLHYKQDRLHWMLMGNEGLKKLKSMEKTNIIKRHARKQSDISMDF